MSRQAIFPDRETVKKLKAIYPAGTRVELLYMDDEQAPPVHTKGTVTGVDDAGSILVDWDNGSRLHAAFGADVVSILSEDTAHKAGLKLSPKPLTLKPARIVLRTPIAIEEDSLHGQAVYADQVLDMANPLDRKRLYQQIIDSTEPLFDSPYDGLETLEKEFKAALDMMYLPFH